MLEIYPPELRDFVAQKIASGEFKSADEFAVRAATIYRDMDRRHQELKESVQAGIDDLEAGRYTELRNENELREFFEQLKHEGRKRLADEQKIS
jgi:Arc/MetJ-type ribon-helix-helix transcriptional regulator